MPPIAGGAGFSVAQTATTNTTTITFASAVTAGDFLYLGFVCSNFGTSSNTLGGVSDNINGGWTILDNQPPVAQYNNSSKWVSGALAYFGNSGAAAASALTITLTISGTAGGNTAAAAVDLAGAATTSPIIGNLSTEDGGPGNVDPQLSPSVTDTNAGDWVIGWWTSYYTGTWTAGTGTTEDVAVNNGAGTAQIGLFHATSIAGGNQVSANTGQDFPACYGTDIVAAPAIPSGPSQFPHRAPRA